MINTDFPLCHIKQQEATHDINGIYDTGDDFNAIMEGSVFEDVIANHCSIQEIENDFVCTPQCYSEINLEHL